MAKCGCKGIRTCLLCEQQDGGTSLPQLQETCHEIHQCHRCGRVLPESGLIQPDLDVSPLFSCGEPCTSTRTLEVSYCRDQSGSEPIRFEGVAVIKDFVSPEEEGDIVKDVDGWMWAESQSGRRKQVRQLSCFRDQIESSSSLCRTLVPR